MHRCLPLIRKANGNLIHTELPNLPWRTNTVAINNNLHSNNSTNNINRRHSHLSTNNNTNSSNLLHQVNNARQRSNGTRIRAITNLSKIMGSLSRATDSQHRAMDRLLKGSISNIKGNSNTAIMSIKLSSQEPERKE